MLNRDIKDIYIYIKTLFEILGMKTIMCEMKNTLDGTNNKLHNVEE